MTASRTLVRIIHMAQLPPSISACSHFTCMHMHGVGVRRTQGLREPHQEALIRENAVHFADRRRAPFSSNRPATRQHPFPCVPWPCTVIIFLPSITAGHRYILLNLQDEMCETKSVVFLAKSPSAKTKLKLIATMLIKSVNI